MTLKPNDVVWCRGVVKSIGPSAVTVTFQGPAASPIPLPLDPSGPFMLDDPDTPPA